jgi:hypothetical protein
LRDLDPAPERKSRLTSQGSPRTILRRALQHGNAVVAEATARELPRLDLLEALELTALIARREPGRLQRIGARWMQRFIEEVPGLTLQDISLAVAAASSLGTDRHADALELLRSLASPS